MKIRIKLFIPILILFAVLPGLTGQSPVAVKGVLDLREIRNRDKFNLNLNGEWEFYWEKMLYPHDFQDIDKLKPDIYGKVPSYWTDYSAPGFKTEKFGYATYRLEILLPEHFIKTLGFEIPVFDSAYDLWINNELKSSNGQTGKSEAESKPEYRQNFFRHIPVSDTISIIINVSNYSHRRGGFWLPMQMGTFAEVQRAKANAWAGAYATTSLLLGFALFFLIFFALYPKDRIMAYFSIALIGLALRPLFSSPYLIFDFTEMMGWQTIVRIEYICLYLVMIGWAWFADSLYPTRLIRLIAITITALLFIALVLTLILPVKLFTYAILAYYPFGILLITYALVRSFTGMLKRRAVDIVYFTAFLIFTVGIVHDIQVAMGKSGSHIGYVMSFVMVIFIFIQAVLLLYKWIFSFFEKEKLHKELEFLNRNLEKLVSERTLELKTRNEEIGKQNIQIALQNKQLSETLQLKNKIFSVIAHDLRSPVVNILYMLNLLKEEEYKEKYDTFANSSIQYAQLVINLLENMLVWGRGQEEKIKYSPEKYDLANIILTNLSIFKETSDRKDIAVNFTQIGNSTAYFDKDLMDIVIRNLLSNAVKYTKRGGRISILVKDRSSNGDGVLLKICDNGIGIPPQKQKDLFTFNEIESTPGTENEKGTGLGLKLCHELIKLNLGIMSVESREGEGTCFMIILPDEKPQENF